MEQALINLYTNRKVIEAALAHLQEYYDRYYELDIFALGDDFAANTSLLFPTSLRNLRPPRLGTPTRRCWQGGIGRGRLLLESPRGGVGSPRIAPEEIAGRVRAHSHSR